VFIHGSWNAAGVIAGIAPFLSLPADTSTFSAGMGQTASVVLSVLVGLNLVLLFLINFRLRKETAVQAGAEIAASDETIEPQTD